ncbi:MAG: VCBS repeat-containing protein, partial [Planctomycetes bacterium]|nr:VCBS repeat-containing protein [Planctomycetota bacterium]
LAEPGGRLRLYENDGRGFFHEAPDRMGAALRVGHMGVHLVDIDGDFDVDCFGPNRTGRATTGHDLLRNDGRGFFHDESAKIPATTGGVYEADVADLDGDGDLDLFFTSLSETEAENTRFPLGEGPMRNRLAEDGELGFEKGEALGQDDDNEVALLDYDQDGDLDAFIGSLGPMEKVLRNDGGMVFTRADGVVEVRAD